MSKHQGLYWRDWCCPICAFKDRECERMHDNAWHIKHHEDTHSICDWYTPGAMPDERKLKEWDERK